MATTQTAWSPSSPPSSSLSSPSCDSNPSHLLKRAIDLIDPPQSSPGHRDQSRDDINEGEAVDDASTANINGIVGESPDAGAEPSPQTSKKRVRFSKSCSPPRRSISVSDAIQAYDLLIAASTALSSSMSPPRINGDDDHVTITRAATTSWETLQCMADTYRALHVTSCLLMELLLSQDISKSHDNTLSLRNPPNLTIQPTTMSLPRSSRPELLSTTNVCVGIPILSKVIEKTILSTSRRCILLLKALERICAAKAISQRHEGSLRYNSLQPTSCYDGGDDIQDHDRSISDLCANYDWHDDGYLPLPLSSNRLDIDKKTHTESKQDKSDLHGINIIHRSNRPSNILHQCCYRPQYPTDPPSSKLEKNAWTRDWIRGERIVSLQLEDYQHCMNWGDFEQGDEEGDLEHAGTAPCKLAAKPTDDCNYSEPVGQNNDSWLDGPENGSDNHENGIIDLSSEVLAEEEELFLDIVFPGKRTTPGRPRGYSNNKSHSPGNIATERRKRKRQSNKLKQHLQKKADSTTDTAVTGQECGQSVHTKEGFLLLANHDNTNCLGICDEPNSHSQINRSTKPIRVFARLQPSGVLSIEDCSIRRRDSSHKNDETRQQSLPPRVRYLDCIIESKTKCQPEKALSALSCFHFRLDCINSLGASSLCRQSLDSRGDITINNMPLKHGNGNKPSCFLFGVDEETGGTFVDGFEWITALSGAANTASLLEETIHSEWGHSVDFPED